MPALLVTAALWTATLQAQEVPPRVGQPLEERGTLVAGAISDGFPYSYTGADGRLTGFSVELLDAVARVMNLRMQREVAPSREIQRRFREGEMDFVQTLTQSPARESYADFSVPFLTLQGAIFVRKDGPVRQLADLNGRKFAIGSTGTVAEQLFRDKGLRVEAISISSTVDGLRMVESGEVAGVFVSQLTGLSVVKQENLRHTVMLGQPIPHYDIRHCFAVHHGDAYLLARLNEGLAILHQTGEFEQIYRKWFGGLTGSLVSREQVIRYSLIALAAAFLLSLWGLLHQRSLRKHIAGQAAELAGQQALLRTLYDNIPMAMCVLEATPGDYRILSINRGAEAWFGLPADQAAGRPLAGVPADPEWMAHFSELLQRGLTVAAPVREERRLAAARKRLIFTLVPMTPDPAGHARLCVLVEDITERRNLDEEIAQSRKLRAVGELVGGIAHEFNNLLTPIMLKVGEIQLNWRHDQRLVGETRLIAEAVQRSAELTRRLLTFGRKADSRLEEVHLGTLINNCFSLLRLTVERRIRWEQDVPAGLPSIYFSPTNLNQIILNLVINARDTLLDKLAAQRGEWTPCIRVEVRLLPAAAIGHLDGTPSLRQILGWQRLTVRDNGLGITAEVRERMFEPFFTTKDVGKGTGLGLATVWHLVTEISGRIEVESVPGEGTAFHVFLPMLPAPDGPATAAPVAAPAPVSRHARIFLAEDDDLVATSVTLALEHAGHQVVHLPDGAEAWQHLQTNLADYQLLIFDVNMPGLDGIELAQRVRTTSQYTGPILVTSGRLGSDDLKQLAEAHVERVLNKPFAVAELLEAVNRCLAGRAGS